VKTKSTILVVDDELFFRSVLKNALEDQYDIIEGENGEDAISQPSLMPGH